MNRQTALLVACLALGFSAGYYSEHLEIKGIVDKAPATLAIVIAALFVRLARGAPPFPFEKIESSKSNRILESLEHLRKLYSHTFMTLGISIILSIIYSVSIENISSPRIVHLFSGLVVFLISWSIALAYSIYSTDIALFKAHTEAIQSVVDDMAAKEAEATAKAVKSSFQDK